ncbi:MAG: cupin domain-containing protein [Eubacteriales bacterium]|nr:cupin domain-containing protein [Eubacteriales bacterium]
MNEKAGVVFSIAKENAPVPYCTISKDVVSGKNSITYFSLAANTDISAESHPERKLLIVNGGDLEVFTREGQSRFLKEGEFLLLPSGITAGMRSKEGVVYTEIALQKEDSMNQAIKAGEVFKLADLLPYQDGKIVNMDVVKGEGMKFALLSFDKGTGLSEHAAPGEAIVFALDGEGIIGYEGKEYPIKAGENFHFAKGGRHYVKANSRFKMALLLTLV